MDELSLYKVKQDLIEYLDKKFADEKGLIQFYIGLGLKIALGSLGLAVVIFGFFGWKSYSDVNKTIQSEIKDRFSKDNPVKNYDNLLKDVTVSAIMNSMRVRNIGNRGSIYRDDASLKFLSQALQDEAVNFRRKIEILQLGASLPASDATNLARDASNIKIPNDKFNREENHIFINNIVNLYGLVNVSQYNRDLILLAEQYRSDLILSRSISRAALRIRPNEGLAIVEKLSSSQDKIVRFNCAAVRILNKTSLPSDLDIVKSSVVDAVNDRGIFSTQDLPNIGEILLFLSSLKNSSDMIWQISHHLYLEASKKNFMIVHSNVDRFDEARVDAIELRTNGYSIGLNKNQYRRLLRILSSEFISLSNAFENPKPEDIDTISFFMMRQLSTEVFDSKIPGSNVSYFQYTGKENISDENGEAIAVDRRNDRMAISVNALDKQSPITVYWRDNINILQKRNVKKIVGLLSDKLVLREYKDNSYDNDDL